MQSSIAIGRLIRSVRILARDGRIPRPLRGLAAFAVLPVPGPVDEAALLLVGLLLWAFYRDSLRDAWNHAEHAGRTPAAVEESAPSR